MSTDRRKATLARQQWMRDFERIVTEIRPELSGRIDWNTPTFFFNSGLSAADAAARFIKRPESPMPRPVNPQVKESNHD